MALHRLVGSVIGLLVAGLMGAGVVVPVSASSPGVVPGATTVRTAGVNLHARLELPDPPVGVTYIAIDIGASATAALRSDGQVVMATDLGWQAD